MAEIEDIQSWIGADVVDPDDNKVGKLDDVIVDVDTGEAVYGVTKSGLITRRAIAPLTGASFSRGYVRIAVAAELVSSAPVDATEPLTPSEHARLGRHFGQGETSRDEEPRRFESVTALAERRRQAEADLQRAEQLEAEAAHRHEESGSLHHDAKQSDAEANELEAERDRLLAEAAEARAAAATDEPR